MRTLSIIMVMLLVAAFTCSCGSSESEYLLKIFVQPNAGLTKSVSREVDDAWSMYGKDYTGQRRTSAVVSSSEPSVTDLYIADSSHFYTDASISSDNHLYIALTTGASLVAVDGSYYDIDWIAAVPGTFSEVPYTTCAPAINSNGNSYYMYGVDERAYLFSHDDSGNYRWTNQLSGEFFYGYSASSVMIHPSSSANSPTLICQTKSVSQGARIIAIRDINNSPSTQWTCSLADVDDMTNMVISPYDGTIYVAGWGSGYSLHLFAIDYTDGSLVVPAEAISASGSHPTLTASDDGDVYILGSDGLLKYDSNLDIVWSEALFLAYEHSASVDYSGHVFVACWVLGGSGYVKRILAFDPVDGDVIWMSAEHPMYQYLGAIALDGEGKVIASGEDGMIRCYEPDYQYPESSADPLWEVNVDVYNGQFGAGNSLSIGPDGAIYYPRRDSNQDLVLYKLD